MPGLVSSDGDPATPLASAWGQTLIQGSFLQPTE